jgi:hypothetical protein
MISLTLRGYGVSLGSVYGGGDDFFDSRHIAAKAALPEFYRWGGFFLKWE